MRRFSVSRGGNHGEIRIESGLLLRVGRLCREALPDARAALLVTDANVAPLYAQGVFDSLAAVGCRVRTVVLDAGEQTKTPETAVRLCRELADFGLTQTDAVVSLGGGVVSDAAGFAASIYLGGVPFVAIPTSLLSQADAAVDGAAALNLPQGKNLVSVGKLPVRVLVDPDCLMSLPARDFSAGMAEVIKLAAAADAALFQRIAACRTRGAVMGEIEELLAACCDIKTGLFAAGRPGILRYGHTFGHAIERAYRFGTVLHGEAVSAGMCQANAIGELLGLTPPRVANSVRALLSRFSLPTEVPLPPQRYRDCLRRDLASAGERVSAVFLTEIGTAQIESFTAEELLSLCGGA